MLVFDVLTVVLIACSFLLLVVSIWVWKNGRKKVKEEDSFSTLFEHQPEAWLIMDGITLKTIKANQKAMNMFGIFREQYLNQLTFQKLFQEDLSDDEAMLLVNAVDNNTFINKSG